MRSVAICAAACSNPSARPPSSAASVRASAASFLLLARSASVRSSRNCAAALSSSVGNLELSHAGRKIRRPRGDDDVSTPKTGHEFSHLSDRLTIVNVVEDHQPRGVELEPAQDGGDLRCVVARLFLWQVKNLQGRQPRQTRVERQRLSLALTNSSAE